MSQMVKNTLKLCLITLVAGILLGAVYEITKVPRKNQEEKTQQQAYKKVFSQADSFKELSQMGQEDGESIYKAAQEYIASKAEGAVLTEGEVLIDKVVYAFEKDECKGCVVTVTSKEGFGGDIQFTVGVTAAGTISGVSVLSISETAGLGMKAKEESFLEQYKQEEKIVQFTVTKKGEEGADKIDAISGATITTNAMTKGVNGAMKAAGYFMSLENTSEQKGEETNE